MFTEPTVPLSVLPATAADLPDILALVRDLAVYEKEPEAVTATLADYSKAFQEGIFEALIVKDKKRTIGMALFFICFSTWKGKMLFLEDFVVKEADRRRGIGKLLFDTLIDTARQRGVKLIKWQVLDWNEPALDFYNKYQATIEQNWWNGKLYL